MYQITPRAGLLDVLDAKSPFQAGYLEIIAFAVCQIKGGVGAKCHSVYLSGDVARRAAEQTADIELTLVVTRALTASEYLSLNSIKWRIEQSSKAVKRAVLDVVIHKDVIDLRHIFHWGFFFKHCTVCLLGENIANSFGHFEMSWEVAKAMNQDVARRVCALGQKIVLANKWETQLDASQDAATLLIRACFGLVARKEQCWEDNLPRCAQYFLVHYPEKQQEMDRLFYLVERKQVKKRAVVQLLDELSAWLQFEYRRIERKIG